MHLKGPKNAILVIDAIQKDLKLFWKLSKEEGQKRNVKYFIQVSLLLLGVLTLLSQGVPWE